MHSYYAGPKFMFLFPERNNVISVVSYNSLELVLVLYLYSAFLAKEIQAG